MNQYWSINISLKKYELFKSFKLKIFSRGFSRPFSRGCSRPFSTWIFQKIAVVKPYFLYLRSKYDYYCVCMASQKALLKNEIQEFRCYYLAAWYFQEFGIYLPYIFKSLISEFYENHKLIFLIRTCRSFCKRYNIPILNLFTIHSKQIRTYVRFKL